MVAGIIYDIQRFCVHDGPGIRTTAFFKGCPLKCRWCHNPESISPEPEIIFRPEKCIGCGSCAQNCPNGLKPPEEAGRGESGGCQMCARCTAVCPSGALELVGREMTPEELCDELQRDLVFFEQSGGGVTLSGGEPLAQPEFAAAVLDECRRRGLHTAVDTSGGVPPAAVESVGRRADVILYDIKHTDDDVHRKYVGASNRGIIDNLRRLVELRGGGDIIARIPLIPGINDDEDNLKNTGEMLGEVGVRRVHLLPYHRAGTEKYPLLQRTYRLPDLPIPGEKEIAAARSILQEYGLRVRTGG